MERIESLVTKLASSLQTYLGLQREYMMLELTEKLARLLTALILGAVMFVIGILTVIFLAFTIVAGLEWLTGSAMLSYGVVTLLFVGLAYLFYRMRNKWLSRPLTNFFTNLLLKDEDDECGKQE